ncbi:hypothetical protein VA7868_03641 [Vibrio aerogenes CECT 7868]|uniref:Uncharacterized protein n=1 Tax=Vibrio aerogenes CECT 7868 TaxID=1216006 RepID=A0A1M6AQU2_9VIBR|nr:hypothetical protein [Vibrio aerogenes]SHI38801.1 hypothetical protein VA7868_03641 [Vibrio aerogenes CECT 7868]
MLADVQNVMARLVRDHRFCQQFCEQGIDCLDGYALTEEELNYLADIEPESMTVLGDFVGTERIHRREGEFGLFVTELSRYMDYEPLARKFSQQYCQGSLAKLLDARNYYEFFTGILFQYEVPSYLSDLLYFCYQNTRICWVNYNPPAEHYIEQWHVEDKISLTDHYTTILVSREFCRFMEIDGFAHDESESEVTVTLLLVKHPDIPKSSSYAVVEPDSLLEFLLEQKEATALTLVERFGMKRLKSGIGYINHKIEQGFIRYLPAETHS